MKQVYLIVYNSLMFIGWACATIAAVSALVGDQQQQLLQPQQLTTLVCAMQAAATAEIVHSASGIVKGSPLSALIQNAGRDAVLFLFILPVQHAHASFFVNFLYATWGIAEMIRYPYYIALLVGR